MAQRRSSEEVRQLVEQFRASGLSQIDYYRRTGMVLRTLGRYIRRTSAPEQQLMRVNVEAPLEPGTGFVLILRMAVASPAAGDSEMRNCPG
jgi:hypothetical protein